MKRILGVIVFLVYIAVCSSLGEVVKDTSGLPQQGVIMEDSCIVSDTTMNATVPCTSSSWIKDNQGAFALIGGFSNFLTWVFFAFGFVAYFDEKEWKGYAIAAGVSFLIFVVIFEFFLIH